MDFEFGGRLAPRQRFFTKFNHKNQDEFMSEMERTPRKRVLIVVEIGVAFNQTMRTVYNSIG